MKGKYLTQSEQKCLEVRVFNTATSHRQISNDMVHVVDWLPTLLHAAEAPPQVLVNFPNLDGVDQFENLFGVGQSAREEFIYNLVETNQANGVYGAIRYGLKCLTNIVKPYLCFDKGYVVDASSFRRYRYHPKLYPSYPSSMYTISDIKIGSCWEHDSTRLSHQILNSLILIWIPMRPPMWQGRIHK